MASYADEFIKKLQQDLASASNQAVATGRLESNPAAFTEAIYKPDYSLPQGFWSRAIDFVSRPLYGVASFADSIVNIARDTYDPNFSEEYEDNPFSAFGQGISGESNKTFGNVFRDALPKTPAGQRWAGLLGFTGDVALDPINLTPLVATKATKVVRGATKVGKQNTVLGRAKDIKFADKLAEEAKAANTSAAPEMPIQPLQLEARREPFVSSLRETPDIDVPLQLEETGTGRIFTAGAEGVEGGQSLTSEQLRARIESLMPTVQATKHVNIAPPPNPFVEWNGTRMVKSPALQQQFVERYRGILSSEDFAALQQVRSPQRWDALATQIVKGASEGRVRSVDEFIEKAQSGSVPNSEIDRILQVAGANNLDEFSNLYSALRETPVPGSVPPTAATAPSRTVRATAADARVGSIEEAAAQAFARTPEELANSLIDIETGIEEVRSAIAAARSIDNTVQAKATTKTDYIDLSHSKSPIASMVARAIKNRDGTWPKNKDGSVPDPTPGQVAHIVNMIKKYGRNAEEANKSFKVGDWKIAYGDAYATVLGTKGVGRWLAGLNTRVNPSAIGAMEGVALNLIHGVEALDKTKFIATVANAGRKVPKLPAGRPDAIYDASLREIAEHLWKERETLKNAAQGKIIKDEQVTALAGKQLASDMGETLRESFDTAKEGSTTSAIENLANVQKSLDEIPEESVRSVASTALGEEVAKVANETDTLASKTVHSNAEGLKNEAPGSASNKAHEEARQRNVKAAETYIDDAVEKLRALDPEALLDQDIVGNATVESIHAKKMGVIDSVAHPYMYRAGEIGENWSQGWSSHLRILSEFSQGVARAMRPFDEATRQAAFLAYKTGEVPLTEGVRTAYQAMRPYIDQVFDIAGTNPMLGSMFRDGHTLKDINRALKEQNVKFQFNEKAKTMAEAAESWKIADVDDVVDFLQRIHGAKSNLSLRSSVADHFGSLYGMRRGGIIDGVEFKKLPKIVEFDDTVVWKHLSQELYYPVEAIEQMKMMERILKQSTSFKGQSGGIAGFVNNFMDPVLAIWKPGMTILRPGHGVRNGISDYLLNVAAGVYHPRHYGNAGRIMQAGKRMSPEVEQNFIKFATEKPSAVPKGQFAVTLKGGKTSKYSEQAMFQMAYQDGVLPTFIQSEDILHEMGKTAKGLDRVAERILQTKWMQGMAKFNEAESHFFRLAQYSKLMTDRKFTRKFNTIEEARTAAAKETIRFHPDTSRLSPVDKKYMRRIIPFWSWTRQMMPVVFETLLTHPARITAVNKAFYDAGIALGNDPSSLGSPWPDNMLLPSFMRDRMGYIGGDTAFNLGSPTESMADMVNGNFAQNMLGMLNPLAKAPVEMISRQNLQTGNYIPDIGEYVDQQLPGINQFATMTGISPSGTLGSWLTGSERRGGGLVDQQRAAVRGDKEAFEAKSILNFLTGIQLVDINNSTFGRYGASELGRSGS